MKNYLENIVTKLVNEIIYSKYIVITSHKNADPDAVSSAIVLSRFIQTITHKKPYIIFPEGINEVSKKIIKELNLSDYIYDLNFLLKTILRHSDPLYIIVDTSSSGQLGILKDLVLNSKYILIDHHRPSDLLDSAIISFINPHIRSTSELVYNIIHRYYTFEALDAVLLLTGILYDTRRFLLASPNTLWIAGDLLKIEGVDYRLVLDLLRMEMDISERIARLKAAQRLSFKRIGKYIIAYTHVSAFESSVARSIIDLGADVAIVASSNKEVRIVARARQSFYKELGISLGRDIMPKVGEYLRGSGGGHDIAAVASGIGEIDIALEYTVSLITRLIKEKIKNMKIGL